MFGKNPIAPILNKEDGQTLRVVQGSPFLTIQGEGPFAGHPATFIRLHGCNLRCTFCDTQFSDPTDPEVSILSLTSSCLNNGVRLIVITGGEPLRQNILPLCTMLQKSEFLVQIETAGTLWIEGLEKVATVVVSPKTPVIHPQAKRYASAFKYVISSGNQHEGFLPYTATQPDASPRNLAAPRLDASIFLSPMDEYEEVRNRANRRLVAKMAVEYNVIAGLQMHKFLEVD